MNKNCVFLFFLFIIPLIVISDTAPRTRRVCRDPATTDNIIFFFPGNDTCNGFIKYNVYARNGASGPFFLLDSIFNKNAETYRHLNANPGTPTIWYYFIEYIDSCAPIISSFSDTAIVDISPPDTVLIDSVSVDINTNQVQIGWKNNSANDFLNFILYRIDNAGIYTNITGLGIRDTSFVDNGIDPQSIAYFYDLLSRDSCTNPQVFGINPHKPILLNKSVDTCQKNMRLSWSRYEGWPVRSYYIYENIGSGYNLVDSVAGSILSYQKPISLGVSYQYFLRAFGDTTFLVSSSSNVISFNTRLRVDPDSVWLQNVSYSNIGSPPINLLIDLPNDADVSKIEILKTYNGGNKTFDIFKPLSFPINWIDPEGNPGKFNYSVSVFGLCNVANAKSTTLTTLELSAEKLGEDVLITWDSGPKWGEGVSSYNIYRAVVENPNNLVFTQIGSVNGTESSFLDPSAVNLSGTFGVSYLVSANQSNGSPWGFNSLSYSNSVSITGELRVFIPNAFVPSGINSVFRPEGMFIDYVKSSMVIYNRWGEAIISLKDISSGWNGKDMGGNTCPIGVYLYEMIIFDLNGRSIKKTGTVTLLN
jgi:hypothetical protein